MIFPHSSIPTMNRSTVSQVSKPAISPISKSASRTTLRDRQVWKSAIQQTRRSAVRFEAGIRDL